MNMFLPPAHYELFPSVEEARLNIENEIMSYLRETAERYEGAFLSGDSGYRYPEDLTDEQIDSGEVCEVAMTPDEIVRVYSDGTVVVASPVDGAPLERYFDPKKGFDDFYAATCERCLPGLKNRLLDNLVEEIEKDISFYILAGRTARRIGYNFDPERIRIRTLEREPVRIYDGS